MELPSLDWKGFWDTVIDKIQPFYSRRLYSCGRTSTRDRNGLFRVYPKWSISAWLEVF